MTKAKPNSVFHLRFFKTFNIGEWGMIGLVGAAVIFGFVQIGQGVYIKTKAHLAQFLLDKAWERALAGQTISKPWPWADTWPVAKISVPRLGHSAVVLNSVSGEAMAFGPGHLNLTPSPGMPGTSVIAAHRDTHFQFLRELSVGDKISITTKDGQLIRFMVRNLKVVDWNNSGVDPDAPGSKLVLVTCWPFDSNSRGPLRYVVEAEIFPRVEEESIVIEKNTEQKL